VLVSQMRHSPKIQERPGDDMWDAAVWMFIVSAAAFAFGSVFLSNHYRRAHHRDAVELRRRQRMFDVLRDNIRVRRHTHPSDCEHDPQSPASAIADSNSGAQG
jgi:hypothetical protein